jgi:SAM-dependent methyltransferase
MDNLAPAASIALMEKRPNLGNLWETLSQSVHQATFLKLIMSKPRRNQSELRRLSIRPVQIKGTVMLQFIEHFERREVAKNHPPSFGLNLAKSMFEEHFLEVNLFTVNQHLHMLSNLKGSHKLIVKPMQQEMQANMRHDKAKKRFIDPEGLHWHKLGLTDASSKVLPSMQFKFKQIHQYIAILQPLIEPLMKGGHLKVADMGAGKGYLTFALYEFLSSSYKGQFEVTGLEQRPELVELTSQIAKDAGFSGLRFVRGDIAGFDASGYDVLIALHACDTATDDAIATGILAGTKLIVCSPCCHKQVRNAMQAPDTMPMLNYGILWERQAEILTDTLRALIMEKHGYKSHIQEFIDLGHTPKNLLLTGLKTDKKPDIARINEKIAALKNQFGIKRHHLETLLTPENP